jgi:guanylate kinase
VQGAKKIKMKYPESVLIFIKPPSINTLRSRLEKRKKDSKAVIESRINIAANELSEMKIYDFKVVNDKLETAYHRLKKYIRLRRSLRVIS